jgi:hypothetical protein
MLVSIILLFAAALPATAQACLTQELKAPPALEKYMSENHGAGGLAALAGVFTRDKAYYDATVMDFCALRVGGDEKVQDALAAADRKTMDLLTEKWKNVGAALDASTAATPSCKTADDCKDYCKGMAAGKECLPDGGPACAKRQCSCLLTCR